VSALSRVLVDTAVAVSPAEHRTVRREQWHADLRDAAEVGLSPTALAFGALTTALFHRRGVRRTSWGHTMTTTPFAAPTAPHTIRTVPLLVTVAVLSVLMAGPWLILQPNSGYESAVDRMIGVGGVWLLLDLVPGAAISAAILLLPGAASRRRRLGAVLVAAAAVGAVVAPFVGPPSGWPVSILPTVAPLLVALAGWLVAIDAPGRAWLLVLLPFGAAAVDAAGVLWPLVPARLVPCLLALPALSVVVAGLLAWTTSPLRRRTRGEDHAPTLVDKTV